MKLSNHFELAEKLLGVARRDKAKWLKAAKREKKKTDDLAEDREEVCLVCANAVHQVILLMEREVRFARYAAQGMPSEGPRRECGSGASAPASPVAESDAPKDAPTVEVRP